MTSLTSNALAIGVSSAEGPSDRPEQRLFCKAVFKGFSTKHGIGPSSSIKASLDSLLKKGILYRTPEGSYRFADLFMPYWIDYIRKHIR